MSKRKSSNKEKQKVKKSKKEEKKELDMDKEWDKVDAFFSQEYRKESDKIRQQIESKMKWFNNCPKCGRVGAAQWRCSFSSYICSGGHQWWPSENRLIDLSSTSQETNGANERDYYGWDVFQKMRGLQAQAKAQVLKKQAQALEKLSQGQMPDCIKNFEMNPFEV